MALWRRERHFSDELLDEAAHWLREGAEAAREAEVAAQAALQSSQGRTFAGGVAAGAAAEEAAARAAEGAQKVAQAAQLLDFELRLARSTNTFRLWQQAPSWILGLAGVGLTFTLLIGRYDSVGGWVTTNVLLALAVISSFRGPASLSVGTRRGGDDKKNGEADEAEARPTADHKPAESIPEPAPVEPPITRADDDRDEPVRPAPRRTLPTAAGARIVATGRYPDGRVIMEPVALDDFADRLFDDLRAREPKLRQDRVSTQYGERLRGERDRSRTVDLADPRAAGWTFLLAEDDPRADGIIEAIRPLAEHRGMRDPANPLRFSSDVDWVTWLGASYQAIDAKQRPFYIMVIGGPNRIPFHFQALLDSVAAVGRFDPEDVDELDSYVRKLLASETTDGGLTKPETVFFAPDAGPNDATFFSLRYMAKPLAARAPDADMAVRTLFGEQAIAADLVRAVGESRPTLLYTAGHGLLADGDPAEQYRRNGAICGQRADDILSASDISAASAFVPGGVVFQFGCFGYGTPAESDFAHWTGQPTRLTDEDFVAALPRALLAHQRGPVAYIGHVDVAWLHAFDDPEMPLVATPWHERLAPFSYALDTLLTGQPVGLALNEMNKRYDLLNGVLVNEIDRVRRGRTKWTAQLRTSFVDTFVFRSDAQNYLVYGDPAARVRVEAD